MAKISKNIKKLRNERKLTQDLLAEKVNVTRQTISSWENDRTQPDIDMLVLLAKAFDVGIEELIYGEKRNIGFEAPKSDRKRAMIIVFATLGSLLLATGLVIVFVAFWDKIPEAVLAVLSFIPLLLGGGIAIYTHIKKPNSIGWCEGSSVAWVAGLVSTFYFIISLFGINLEFDVACIGVSIMILPIAFLMNSAFPMVIYYVATTCFVAGYVGDFDAFNFIVSVLLFIVGFIFIFTKSSDDYRRKISLWSVLVSSSFVLSLWAIETTESNETTTVIIIVLGIFTALYSADKGEKSAYPFRYICVPAISAVMCILCAATNACLCDGYHYTDVPELLFPGIAPLVSAVIIAVGIYAGKSSFKKNPAKIAFVVLSSSTAAICTVCSVFAEYLTYDSVDNLNIIVTIIALGISITIITAGIKKAKMLTVNLGIIMLCFIIYFTIFAGRFDVVYSGIACIVMGGILLFINYKLAKSFKRMEGEENA
ncbi:MAG: DUF2157 domain-containing protein [Clostridia bacterium]|nr:DUF2157 domain-containing protein [Clostridia bacterium]